MLFYKTTLYNINPLVAEYNPFNFDVPHVSVALSNINPQLNEILNSVGVFVKHAEVFTKLPNKIVEIHTDDTGGDIAKLNWVYGGKNSEMIWYKLNEGVELERNILHTSIGTRYYQFSVDDVSPLISEQLAGAYLIQAGIPHNIVNPLERRVCVSLELGVSLTQRITIESASVALKNYLAD